MSPARVVFFAATLGGIVLAIRSFVLGPPTLREALACAIAYFAILISGVLFIRLRMFADAVVRGPSGSRGVVLTFDDGPHPEHTRVVLDALDKRSAKATFFVIGAKAEAHPEVIREIVDRGHAVGVHGFEHDRLFALRGPSRVRADLRRAVASLEKITGTRPTLFRPPIGHTNPTIARIADELDLTVVGWSIGARDGLAGTRPRDVITRITEGLEDGAIVLLHDAAEVGARRPAGVSALPGVLEAIATKDLWVVPLAPWLEG